MSFICKNCQRNFTTQSSCSRHTKRCCLEIELLSDEEMNSDIIFIESESEKINNSSSSEVKNIYQRKFT